MNDQIVDNAAILMCATALVARTLDRVADQAGDSLDTSAIKEGIVAELVVEELREKKESR